LVEISEAEEEVDTVLRRKGCDFTDVELTAGTVAVAVLG
jgi:hypothetical protein